MGQAADSSNEAYYSGRFFDGSFQAAGSPSDAMITTVVPSGLAVAVISPTAVISVEPRPRSMLDTRSRHWP